jgi:hypothetical protein
MIYNEVICKPGSGIEFYDCLGVEEGRRHWQMRKLEVGGTTTTIYFQ